MNTDNVEHEDNGYEVERTSEHQTVVINTETGKKSAFISIQRPVVYAMVATIIFLMVAMIGGFVWGASQIDHQIDTNAALTEEISGLRQDLSESQDVISNALNVRNEEEACQEALLSSTVNFQNDFLRAIGDLVVAIADPNNDEATGPIVVAIEENGDAWDAALRARTQWNEQGRPLPCPLPTTVD